MPQSTRRRRLCVNIVSGMLFANVFLMRGGLDMAHAVPAGSAPPVNGMSTTGDASQTLTRPSYSSIGQTAQRRVSWVYDLAEDGARGDAVSDSAALVRAIAYAGAHSGTVIRFPAGTWALTTQNGNGFMLPSNTTLEGASEAGTILTWNDDQANVPGAAFVLFGGYNGPQVSNVSFRNFTVLGKENVTPPSAAAELGEATQGGYPFLVTNVTGLTWDHVAVQHSRIMSIVARMDADVTVSDCLVQYSSRDGISVGQSTNISITDNVVEHAGDDAIAAHSQTSEPWGARRDLIITGNRIFDAQGIRVLSARSANISGNIIDSVRQLGINVETVAPYGGGGEEGAAATADILIADNVITNVISRQNVDGLNSGADYILVTGASARAGSYSGVPGTPGTDGVVHSPYMEFAANSSLKSVPTDPATGITITGNILGRMIPPTDGTDSRFKQWTDLGFGSIWVQNKGNLSPSLGIGDITGVGVHMYSGVFRDVLITNNQMIGLNDALQMDDASDYGTVQFRGNTVSDMRSYGVLVNTGAKGRLVLDDNMFDLDPYFSSSARGSNGTWASANGPVAIQGQSYARLGLIARHNIVRNVAADSNVSTADPPQNWTFIDNIVEADPNSNGAFDATNKGVGLVRETGGFHLVQTDSDPASPTYGQVLNNAAMNQWSGMPTAGKWLKGQALWNSWAGNDFPCGAYVRLNTGTGNALDTDWGCVPVLVGLQIRNGGPNNITIGKANDPVLTLDDATGYAAFSKLLVAKTDMEADGHVYLDAKHSMWVQETGGKVVVGTGTTNLFSIDASGNVLARGTITPNASP